MEVVKDNYIFGVFIGLLMPFLGFFGFYQWKFSLFTVQEFLDLLNQQKCGQRFCEKIVFF